MELACSPDSLLTSEALKKGFTAERCSVWNGYDLRTGEGVKQAIKIIREKKPRFLWIATECGAFSPIQNCNQRTPEQQEALKRKQMDARKQHVGALVVAHWAHAAGSVVCWEWSRRCRAWKWDLLDDWRNHCNTSTAIISGCQVGLKDPKTGVPLGKEWRVECTDRRLSERLHNTCACLNKTHALCEGQATRMTAFYTPEFVRRVVYHMSVLDSDVHVLRASECETETHTLKRQQGCWCKRVHKIPKELTCHVCMQEWSEFVFAGDDAPPLEQQVSREERDRILKLLFKIHSATGHGSYELLLKTLQRRQVSPHVLAIAKSFRCSACDERKRPDPRRQANLEVHTDRWRSVQIDTAYWKHPISKKQVSFSLVMDEASRFLVGKVMRMDGGKGVKASEYAELFTNHWFPYFGMPDVVRSDPEGAFRSEEMLNFFSERGIHLDHIPAEAHWNLSHVERCIEWVKEFLTKTAGDAEQDVAQLIQHAIYTWNHRETVRGYSPFQHAIGRQPDIEGRVFDRRTTDLPMEMMQSPDGEMEVASQLRQQASKAFIDWQVQEKLTRARNSKHHPRKDFFPGDLVFYWRTQLGNAERQNSWNRGNYVGPARVLAVETRQEHGQLRASSVVWLVRGNRLVKVAQEQLRPASMRETCLHELTRPPQLPWTFNSLAGDLHKASFQDHTGPGPSENKRSLVEPEELDDTEHPTNRRRVTGKQQQSRQQDRSRSPKPSRSEDAALFTGPSWQELVPESAWLTTDTRTTWDNPHAAVELTLELPTDQRKLRRFMNNPVAYFASALKRRSVEVSERHLSALEHEQFAGAKKVEVDKFIAAEALQALPEHLQPARHQALRMRWVLTWKHSEDGSSKPKARAVVLGYMDPEYQHRPTFAPTMTRHSRQMLIQWASNHGCQVKKGDVAAAFLQGREFNRDLYLIPTVEICEAMNLAPQSVVKMRKACYGLVEAPIEWFETMNQFLKSLGFSQLKSDPCMWRYKRAGETLALISGHVDDFLFTGIESPEWTALQEAIQQKFKWQEWECNDFVQCGVHVQSTPSGGFSLEQTKYLGDVQEIRIARERKKQVKEETTPEEKTELRGLLGALSWHANQVGYRFVAYTSLFLSEVNTSTVQTLLDVNGLLCKMRLAAKDPMHIFPFEPQEEPQFYCWVDASSQNRHDGSSTKGIFIGMSGKKLGLGEVDRVSPIFWQSGKIERVCRSPGSAEARAAIDAEDTLFLVRYQWSEIMGYDSDSHNIYEHVSRTCGTLITDSRNVFDRVDKPYITPKGAQKRIDLELITLKESQQETGLRVRWVNSQAMLANSITKRGEDIQMCRFVQLGQRWKIVHDELMFSGRKRQQQGKDVFD